MDLRSGNRIQATRLALLGLERRRELKTRLIEVNWMMEEPGMPVPFDLGD